IGSPIIVTGNTFAGYDIGVDIGGARDVSVTSNIFTPKAGSTGFVSVRVDSHNASANADPTTPINTTIEGNPFITAPGATGTAIASANTLPSVNFTGVNVGVTADNNYASGLVVGVSVSGGVATVSDHITGATTGIQVTGGQVTLAGSSLDGNTTGV